MIEKQFNKLVDQIVKTAITAELKGITKDEVISRYNKVLEEYGIEKADFALQHTLKQFKERAKEKEKNILATSKKRNI
jgi:aspartyl-tRNA synthetase